MIVVHDSADQSESRDGEVSGVPPPLIRGSYHTFAANDESLTIHVSVLDLVVLVDALHGTDDQHALLPFCSASGLVHHCMYGVFVDGSRRCRAVDHTSRNLLVCSPDQMLDAGGATYILQHDFACRRDICPVGADVAVNISWRM